MTLPIRYSAPAAHHIWYLQNRIDRMVEWSRRFITEAILQDHQIDDEEQFRLLKMNADDWTRHANVSILRVSAEEKETGHDVVALLKVLESGMPAGLVPYLHLGLTSSDLVENAHFDDLCDHALEMELLCVKLLDAVTRWEGADTRRVGRTHGQIADITSWNWQMKTFYRPLHDLRTEFRSYGSQRIMKSPGPVGNSWTRGSHVANQFGYQMVASTQVIPRDCQTRWACLYLRLAGVLENIALLVRAGARSEIAEVREGARRVGSSAMPHKRNPIDSEKVCGMARLARGYFITIAEGGALWDDRDISNSSMERVAVPDLASTVEHMAITMIDVLNHLELDGKRMLDNAGDPRTASNLLQVELQKQFKIGPVRAGALVREWVNFDVTVDHWVADCEGLADRLGVTIEAVERWDTVVFGLWRGRLNPITYP